MIGLVIGLLVTAVLLTALALRLRAKLYESELHIARAAQRSSDHIEQAYIKALDLAKSHAADREAFFREILVATRADWNEEIERMEARHKAEMERLTNALTYQRPEIPPAVILPVPDDAEARVLAQAHRESVERVTANLKDQYREAGYTHYSDDEIEQHAEQILRGEQPDVNLPEFMQ